ncbi:MAG: OsmC family protein, partial [Elusimicrobiales bacterium]|nr:OsmC family protein [Elusimicrobiales bacterium]
MSKYIISFPGNKKVNVKFKEFEIKTDQPKESGGDGTAPSPYELFLSSLAACAGFFAISFFQTRKIDMEGFSMYMEVNWDSTKHRLSKII